MRGVLPGCVGVAAGSVGVEGAVVGGTVESVVGGTVTSEVGGEENSVVGATVVPVVEEVEESAVVVGSVAAGDMVSTAGVQLLNRQDIDNMTDSNAAMILIRDFI